MDDPSSSSATDGVIGSCGGGGGGVDAAAFDGSVGAGFGLEEEGERGVCGEEVVFSDLDLSIFL